MSQRVLLGRDNAGVYKLRVSKAGKNVLTDAFGDMLFDSEFTSGRIIQQGMHLWAANTTGPRTIPIADIGTGAIWPMVLTKPNQATWQPFQPFYDMAPQAEIPSVTISGSNLVIAANPSATYWTNSRTFDRYIYYMIVAA